MAAENVSRRALAPAKKPGSNVTPLVNKFLNHLAALTSP